MSEEIKPCPFCGGEAELYSGGIKYVLCKECLATSCDFKTEAEAIEAWNRRANDVGERPYYADDFRRILSDMMERYEDEVDRTQS
ncbi:MAG: Lar family restriction alleviation protein [Clostridia bacterium]|nr:Lar family restriction alleviation protein [Clostridia bacterium]